MSLFYFLKKQNEAYSFIHSVDGSSTRSTFAPLIPTVFPGKCEQSSSSQNQHSYSWYQNASESDKKPLAQTTTLKTGSKADSSYDSWDVIMGLRSPSPSQEPRNPAPTLSWASAGSTAVSCERREKAPSPPQLQSPGESEDPESDFFIETSDFSQTTSESSSSTVVRNSNCRTYRRPNKQGPVKASDPSSAGPVPADSSIKSAGRGRGRGRTRDYTVLHPSSMSRCNVTIHDRGVEEFGTDATPPSGSSSAGSGSTTELVETGWQRKKTEQNTR